MKITIQYIKMMMTLFTVLFVIGNGFAQTGNVREDVARQVATNFLMLKDDNPRTNVQLTRVNATQYPNLYVYNTSDKGFVVVSSDNRMEPILAYSDEFTFDKDNVAPGANFWFEMYEETIDYIVRNDEREVDEKIAKKWEDLYSGSIPEKTRDLIFPPSCAPLIQTHWGQGNTKTWENDYNQFCPWYEKNGKKYRAVTGCVATALGQLMNYLNNNIPERLVYHPFLHDPKYASEFSSLCIVDSNNETIISEHTECNNAKHYFRIGGWNNITNTATNPKKREAKIMLDCGLVVDMRYGIESSASTLDPHTGYVYCDNSSSAEYALKTYFGYPKANGKHRKDYTDDQWRDTLKKYISNGQPLMYRGGRYDEIDEKFYYHSFICDGYDSWNCFHFNFGWGENNNAYYWVDWRPLYYHPHLEYHYEQACLIAKPVMQHDVTNIDDVIDFPESKTTTWYGNTILVEYDDNPSIYENPQTHTYNIKYNRQSKFRLTPIIMGDKMLNYSVTVLPVDKDTLRESEIICRRAGFHGIYGSGDDVITIDLSHDETDFVGTQKFYRIINNNVTGEFSGVLELELTTNGVISETTLPAVTVNRCDLLPDLTYHWEIGGEVYYIDHSCVFEKSFNTGANCDSVVYLPLTIIEPDNWYRSDTILCYDKCPINFYGLQINDAGVYHVCDNGNLYTLNVGMVNFLGRPFVNINACVNETPVTWNNCTFPWTELGTYDTVIERHYECQCDTIYDVHVVISNDCCVPDLDCLENQIEENNNRDVQTNKEAIYYGLKHYYNYRDAINGFLANIFKDVYWTNEERNTFWNNFQSLLDSNTGLMTEQKMQQLIVTNECQSITEGYIIDLVERYNRSVMYWNEGYYSVWYLPQGYNTDFIEYDTTAMNKAYDALQYAQSRGFSDVRAMYDNAYQILESEVENVQSSVCAHVTVQFTQKMTMTREAFNGTLQIFNGHESLPMQDIMVDFMIKDQNGNDCTNLFQINTLSLEQITGISGDGSLAAQTSGTATIQFIPTKNAAPTQPVVYSFGGSFSFIDPFTGEGLTYPLYPVEITVNPSPDLYVDYFMQRDILGDDALTLDKVEPSIPAELGVIIDNKGAGIAKNVTLETAEPQIIDNEKGLAIDFAMYGASFNGSPRQLGLMEIPFGNIESGHTAVGEWLFTSSLLGHFVSYEAHVIHNSSYGNQDLSLVSHLDIHELIHPIYAYGNLDDGINDFLVNDVMDAYHMPDSIYFSHGGKTAVGIVDDISYNHVVTALDTIVTLTINPSRIGWNYGVTSDPGEDKYNIVSCTKNIDNQEIPLSNVWQTFVTIPDGGDPVYENNLHIIDTLGSTEPVTYTLVYTLKTNLLDVEEIITGIDDPSVHIEYPLTSFQVKFNEKIIDSTFTYRDMTLKCNNGDDLMNENVVITKVADSLYNVDITGLTNETGYYVLNVHTLNIKDERGYTGYNGKQATWIQYITAITQNDTLVAGWNWWSTYIEQSTISGLDSLEKTLGSNGLQIKSHLAFVDNYYPTLGYNYWYGSLTDIDNESSYRLKLVDDGVTTVKGPRSHADEHEITINPEWNWIGYPLDTKRNVNTATDGFTPEANDIMKSHNESSIYYSGYGWYPVINLEPGKGYMYKSNADVAKTLTYNVSRNEELATPDAPHLWTTNRHAFADNLTVIAAVYVDGERLADGNMELGAFVNGECRGSAILKHFPPLDCYYAVLTVSGEDGDAINFGLIDRIGGVMNFNSQENMVFEKNAVAGDIENPYEVRFSTASNSQMTFSMYPNPVEKGRTITLDIPGTETVTEVVITDILGTVIRRNTDGSRVVKGLTTRGVYDIQVFTASGIIYHGRLIVM